MQAYLEGFTALHSAVAQAEGSRAAGLHVRREPIETVTVEFTVGSVGSDTVGRSVCHERTAFRSWNCTPPQFKRSLRSRMLECELHVSIQDGGIDERSLLDPRKLNGTLKPGICRKYLNLLYHTYHVTYVSPLVK
jgi:hypothetical protein